MNVEAEKLIAKAIINEIEITPRGLVTFTSAETCAKNVIEALKNLDAERAFKDVHSYSIQYGNEELWKMFLDELLK